MPSVAMLLPPPVPGWWWSWVRRSPSARSAPACEPWSREAFQELDYRSVFGSIAKWVVEIDDPARVPELAARAFREAVSGRPGPVVVALPEDMLTDAASVADALPCEPVETHPSLGQMAELQDLLRAAERPVAIVGGARWSARAVQRLQQFAERFELPVHTSFRLSEEEMTSRIVAACEHPWVDCIGHLTGRKIEARAPYAVDVEAVVTAAARTGTPAAAAARGRTASGSVMRGKVTAETGTGPVRPLTPWRRCRMVPPTGGE